MLEQPKLNKVPAGMISDETVTVPSHVNNHTPIATDCTVNMTPVNTDTHITSPIAVNNPTLLYDTLAPLLLHQQSTLTSLQILLNPIKHEHTIPCATLTQLHRLLGANPRTLPYLPPFPHNGLAHSVPPLSLILNHLAPLPYPPPHPRPSPSHLAPRTE